MVTVYGARGMRAVMTVHTGGDTGTENDTCLD